MIQAPVLEIDALMANRYGQHVSPQGKLERRIVANLIVHLRSAGFKLHSINDGDEIKPVRTPKEAMELVFAVDEVSLRFYKNGRKGRTQEQLQNDAWHGVLLVLGNGCEIISDWNYVTGDADGFNSAMDAFDAEQYA